MCARVADYPSRCFSALRDVNASEMCSIPKLSLRRVLKPKLDSATRALAAAWHFDGNRAVCAYQGGALLVWDVANSSAVQYALQPFAMAIATCPYLEKTLVAAGGLDNAVAIIDMSDNVEKCEKVAVLPCPGADGHDGLISALTFLDRKTLISASGDGDLRLWDTEKVVGTQVFHGHGSDICCVAHAPLACAQHLVASGSLDSTVRVWDVRSGEATHVFQANTEVAGVSLFPNGNMVAAGGADGAVRLFDIRSSVPVGELHANASGCTGIEWSNSGRVLYTSHVSGELGIWEAFGTGAGCVQKVRVVPKRLGEEIPAAGLALSPDGSGLLSPCHDSTLRLTSIAMNPK